MRVIDRLNLIDRIGRELQSRMTYTDIDIYLGAFGVDTKKKTSSTNSKWLYVKELLSETDVSTFFTFADELGIEQSFLRFDPVPLIIPEPSDPQRQNSLRPHLS